MPPKMKGRCESCRHFRMVEGLTHGECYRYPPPAAFRGHSGRPRVSPKDFCGEWAAKQGRPKKGLERDNGESARPEADHKPSEVPR
jgi:hypothetical protein